MAAAPAQPPFRYTWPKTPVAHLELPARATDHQAATPYARPVYRTTTDAGANQSLPEPWGQQALGKKDRLIPGTSPFAPAPPLVSRDPKGSAPAPTTTPTTGTFTLIQAGGQVTEDDDAPLFVYQPVTGD